MRAFLVSSILLGLISNSFGNSVVKLPLSSKGPLQTDLLSYGGSELYAEITLGTPPQSFKTVLDMGHSDSWVPSSKCGSLNIPCKTHDKYDSENSTTYKEDGSKFKIKYKIGVASGFLSQDTLCLGKTCIEGQRFGEATSESIDPFANAYHDGVLGIGFGKESLLNNLIEQELIENPLFSIWLNTKPFRQAEQSQLILGGIDSSRYQGNISYIPLNSESIWSVEMKSISIKGMHRGCGFITKPGCDVVFDAGSKFSYGPILEAKTINRWIGATQIAPSYGYYKIRCNEILTLPNIEFVFEGRTISLRPQDYIVETKILGMKVCLTGFVGLTRQETTKWTLGANFLEAYYSVYDVANKRIGLAASQRAE